MIITAAPPATSSSSSRILRGIIAADLIAVADIAVAVGIVMFESHPAATYLVGIRTDF